MVDTDADSFSGISAPDEATRLAWVYEELLRVERHWTDQLQNQQRRIAAVLAVNGFLLAFLATSGLQNVGPTTGWAKYPFFVCLIVLAVALMFGILTLLPQVPFAGADRPLYAGERKQWLKATFRPEIPQSLVVNQADPTMDLWLDSKRSWAMYQQGHSEDGGFENYLRSLCESVSQNADGHVTHSQTEIRRRKWMHWQMAGIMASLLLLVIAIAGWMAQSA